MSLPTMTAGRHGSGAPGATAIVLAGGRSSRFGSDKLEALVDGRPILRRAVDAVALVADAVIVVGAPGTSGRLSAILADVSPAVRVLEDASPFEGPLVGLLGGLRAADGPVAIVVAGDMPWLEPGLLDLLLAEVRRGATAASFGEVAGAGRLPFALGVVPARDVAGRLVDSGERRLGALLDALVVSEVPAGTWRSIDPAGRTFGDVDRREDLLRDESIAPE